MNISAAAAEHIRKICPADSGLRVAVEAGGCSGFQYKFSLETTSQTTDTVIKMHDAMLFVDQQSYEYLKNSSLDLVVKNLNSLLVISNPAARTTCGCGVSFST